MIRVALTTEDNPYNPFTQETEWNTYDELMGYYTNCYLARVARTSPDLSPDDYSLAIEEAIDSIVELNLTGNYKKVYMEVDDSDDDVDWNKVVNEDENTNDSNES